MQTLALMNHICITHKDYNICCTVMQRYLWDQNKNSEAMRALRGMPEFYMSGVALTTGFPHGNIGDTALSVLTGCMMTVLNGPFEICAGDVC
eukprot:3932186-Rhodomonas_salina.1